MEIFTVFSLTTIFFIFAWELFSKDRKRIEEYHNIQNIKFFSGKIYLKKKYCSFSNSKDECVLSGFWTTKSMGAFAKDKYILYLKKDKNNISPSILTLVYSPKENRGQINAFEVKKTYKIEYNRKNHKIIKDSNGFQKDFEKKYGREAFKILKYLLVNF